MNTFDADWLALRARADYAARSAGLARRLRPLLDGRPVIQALDLACGTGSNARWLQPRLPRPQHWLLVDGDEKLLEQAEVPDAKCRPMTLDLAQGFNGLDFARFDLVTASALLDLVSERWFTALVARLAESRAALLFALTVDGRIAWMPEDPLDRDVLTAFARHQGRDKGFGPAMGPAAARIAERILDRFGYTVVGDRSDWVLGPEDTALQEALAEGQAAAAIEAQPSLADAAQEWLERRRGHIETGNSRLRIGHRDLLARKP